ncbi:MAG: ABC transporter permease, partial [Limisphaerales bacterium]
MNDLKFAFRQLTRNPGFTAVVVLTLGICLGANLTIFAVIDAVLLRPLPFPKSDRLVTMFNIYPKAGVERGGASLPNYYERRGRIPAFSDVAILRQDTAIVGDAGATKEEAVMRISAEFFHTLGIGPELGRAFTDQEMTYQTDGVAILTDSYWRHQFNADPDILGRKVRVDGLEKMIVGVLPPGFRFLSSKAQLYFPLSSDLRARGVNQRHSNQDYVMIGRLRPGISLVAAQSQIDADNAAHAAEYPDPKMIAEAGFRTVVAGLQADHVRSVRPTLLLLQGGVLLLLLIGGVNLVNLILIRSSSRARELAVRLSLGAGRRHIVKQVMTETVLLTSTGGLFGLAVGSGGIRLLTVLGVRELPLGAQVAFDGHLALVAMLAAVIAGLVIGSPIAFFNLRSRPATTLQSETRSGTASHTTQRLRHIFIVAQVALAFILLTGGGLLSLSLKHVMTIYAGFPSDHVLTCRIALPWKGYQDWPSRLAFIGRLLEGVRSQPGVSAAGVINNVPFSGDNGESAFWVKGYVRKPGEALQAHYFYGVAGDVFTALGVSLRAGRFLGSTDSDRKVCVVDEDFARRYWPQ